MRGEKKRTTKTGLKRNSKMTDDRQGEKTEMMERERWRSRRDTREGEEDACPQPPQTFSSSSPSPPPIPGMMSGFIDFVKPFSMLLPMCLQDSKSRSFRGGGLSGEIQGKHLSLWEGRPLGWSQRQLCSFVARCQHFTPHTYTFPHW